MKEERKPYPFRRDPEYGFPNPGAPLEFLGRNECRYLDILQYRDATDAKYHSHQEGELRDIGLRPWFEGVKGSQPVRFRSR